MSNYMAMADAFKGRAVPTQERVVSVESVVSPAIKGSGASVVSVESVVRVLPAASDTDDPWTMPAAPCAACGVVQWRVWRHDERKVWQWICNRCRPLVVINPDGTEVRA